MKKILIVTDSMGLPRNHPEETIYKETYAYLLSQANLVLQLSLGGARISDLYRHMEYYMQFRPDVVLLHCGIVDAAPRAYRWIEERMFENYIFTRKIRNLISKTITTRRLRRWRKCVWTSQQSFQGYCLLFSQLNATKVFAIGITPPCAGIEAANSGISNNIREYNSILENIFKERFICIDDIPANCIMSDLYHLNASGHRWMYERINTYLSDGN